jgi:hypothetical protein
MGPCARQGIDGGQSLESHGTGRLITRNCNRKSEQSGIIPRLGWVSGNSLRDRQSRARASSAPDGALAAEIESSSQRTEASRNYGKPIQLAWADGTPGALAEPTEKKLRGDAGWRDDVRSPHPGRQRQGNPSGVWPGATSLERWIAIAGLQEDQPLQNNPQQYARTLREKRSLVGAHLRSSKQWIEKRTKPEGDN